MAWPLAGCMSCVSADSGWYCCFAVGAVTVSLDSNDADDGSSLGSINAASNGLTATDDHGHSHGSTNTHGHSHAHGGHGHSHGHGGRSKEKHGHSHGTASAGHGHSHEEGKKCLANA